MYSFELTPASLASIVGVIVSLIFRFVPKLKSWYANLIDLWKATIMVVLMLIVSVATFLIACTPILDIGLLCDPSGALSVIEIFFLAIAANQATYLLTPKPEIASVRKRTQKK
jgi:hypothetical protein